GEAAEELVQVVPPALEDVPDLVEGALEVTGGKRPDGAGHRAHVVPDAVPDASEEVPCAAEDALHAFPPGRERRAEVAHQALSAGLEEVPDVPEYARCAFAEAVDDVPAVLDHAGGKPAEEAVEAIPPVVEEFAALAHGRLPVAAEERADALPGGAEVRHDSLAGFPKAVLRCVERAFDGVPAGADGVLHAGHNRADRAADRVADGVNDVHHAVPQAGEDLLAVLEHLLRDAEQEVVQELPPLAEHLSDAV